MQNFCYPLPGDSRGYSTCLSASAKALRYRLKAAMPGKSKRKGVVLLFMIMLAGGLCMGQLTTGDKPGHPCGADQSGHD